MPGTARGGSPDLDAESVRRSACQRASAPPAPAATTRSGSTRTISAQRRILTSGAVAPSWSFGIGGIDCAAPIRSGWAGRGQAPYYRPGALKTEPLLLCNRQEPGEQRRHRFDLHYSSTYARRQVERAAPGPSSESGRALAAAPLTARTAPTATLIAKLPSAMLAVIAPAAASASTFTQHPHRPGHVGNLVRREMMGSGGELPPQVVQLQQRCRLLHRVHDAPDRRTRFRPLVAQVFEYCRNPASARSTVQDHREHGRNHQDRSAPRQRSARTRSSHGPGRRTAR